LDQLILIKFHCYKKLALLQRQRSTGTPGTIQLNVQVLYAGNALREVPLYEKKCHIATPVYIKVEIAIQYIPM